MNKVILVGNVGRAPELRTTKSDVSYCSFSVATHKTIKGEKYTQWHNIKCWRKTAEAAAQYIKKGSGILVEGELEYSESEKDGLKRHHTSIVCQNWNFVGAKPTTSTSTDQAPCGDDEDIPF